MFMEHQDIELKIRNKEQKAAVDLATDGQLVTLFKTKGIQQSDDHQKQQDAK